MYKTIIIVYRKYYVDIKRREDAFDLSGPYLPKEEPMPHKPVSTLTDLVTNILLK